MPEVYKGITILDTDEDIERMVAYDKAHPYIGVTTAIYDPSTDRYDLTFVNDVVLQIPRRLLQGLESYSIDDAVLKSVEVLGPGSVLHWDKPDIQHYVPDLVIGLYGTEQWMKSMGKRLGSTKTAKTARASRENGKKGGRPRKERIPVPV
jgi:hypothetical protein